MSRVPSLLKMQKSRSHPISLSCHSLLASLFPKSKTLGGSAPLPSLLWPPLGLSPALCRAGVGDPGARSAPCSASTISGRCLCFTLQARVSPRALGARSTAGSSDRGDRAEQVVALGSQQQTFPPRSGSRRGLQTQGGSTGRGHLQDQGQRPLLRQWGRQAVGAARRGLQRETSL